MWISRQTDKYEDIFFWVIKQTASHRQAWWPVLKIRSPKGHTKIAVCMANGRHKFRSISTIRMMRDEWTIDRWIKTRDGVGSGVRLTDHDAGALRGQEINPKFKMKTSVKDVRTLSSEQPSQPRAICKLDRRYRGWDRRRAPRRFGLQRERKTQNSIKQQNKDDEWWMNDCP